MSAIGLTVPLKGVPLPEHRDALALAADNGYTAAWSTESNAADGFTPLVLTAAWQPGFTVGTSVIPAQTRGPAAMAQSFASLAEATPSRVVAGIGASTPIVVQDWNNAEFAEPYKRVRDTVRFLRQVLRGDTVDEKFETFEVRNFRLTRPPRRVPSIMIAAGRPAMLRLAGREADGAIINWVSADDVRTIAPIVRDASSADQPPEVVARVFVCPSTDAEAVRTAVRSFLTYYVTPPGYREFHEWIGRGDRLRKVFEAWDDGDRKRAVAEFPDAVIDEIVVHGSPEACREQLAEYFDAGVTCVSLSPVGVGMSELDVLSRLGAVGDLVTH